MNASRSENIKAALVSLTIAAFSFGSLYTFITLRAHPAQKTAETSLAGMPRKIAYLISPTEALGNLDRSAFVAEGATLIAEDINLKELDAKMPFDALIFDSSAKTCLDTEWLRRRYAHGLIVVGINVNVIELAKLVGDKTAVREQAQLKDTPFSPEGLYYSSLHSFVTGENPAEVELYLTQLLTYTAEAGAVDTVPGISSQLGVSRGVSQTDLTAQTIKLLFLNLRSGIDAIRATKEAAQSLPDH